MLRKPHNDPMAKLLSLPLEDLFIAIGYTLGQVPLDPDDSASRMALVWAGQEIFQTDVPQIRTVLDMKRGTLDQASCMTEADTYEFAVELAVELVDVVTFCPASIAAVAIVKIGLDEFCDDDCGPFPSIVSRAEPQYAH